MSNEEDISCSNCGIKCEQTLLLSCDHNLCMNCAASNLVKNELPGMNKTQYIICDICKQKTEIDTNTSKEVLSLGLNGLNKNKIDFEENLNYKIEGNNNTFQGYAQNSLMDSNNYKYNHTSPVNLDYLNDMNNNNNLYNLSSKYEKQILNIISKKIIYVKLMVSQ
jgi:hypothetical protein